MVYSNSMVEAANRCLKYYCLFQMQIPDFASLQPALDFIVNDYNNRPNNTILGLSPFEVLENKSAHEIFLKSDATITKAQRIAENKKSNCCTQSF